MVTDRDVSGAEVEVRRAGETDVADLVRLRRMMWEAMGVGDVPHLDAADKAAAAYFSAAIAAGTFHGWLAVTEAGTAVGAGGVVIDQHPPGPRNLSGRIGYVMNLVTDPRYRRRGIGRRIMYAILGWLEEQGVRHVALHATDVGRPLYDELGFVDSNEMRLTMAE